MNFNINRRTFTGLLASAAGTFSASRPALANNFPTRPISLTVGYPPGGSTDVAVRRTANAMSKMMDNASVIVENRAGASGTVASYWLKRQPADGYSLMLSESGSFAIMPALGRANYDPIQDFTWISTICTAPSVFVVGAQSPFKTIQQALDVLKTQKSSELPYSSSGAGSTTHIAAEMLKHALGKNAKSLHVPYSGGAPSVLSISKGETAWGVPNVASAAGQIEGGMLRPLAVTSAKRFPKLPDVPTFTEIGLPEMVLEVYYLVHGPSKLPDEVVEAVNRSIISGLNNAEEQEKFLTNYLQLWSGDTSPSMTKKIVAAELDRFKIIADQTGIIL